MLQKIKISENFELSIIVNPENSEEYLNIISQDAEYLGFYNYKNRQIILTPISTMESRHADIIDEIDDTARFTINIENQNIRGIIFDTFKAGIEYENMKSDETIALGRIYKAMDKLSKIFNKSIPTIICNRNKTIETTLR